uniref:TLD domaincontaining protein KIAA1609like [Cricetulus griseus] n=1 Tax=Lepeophtheirus salmonis TaxID=72036 RepID=A0A0K2TQS8_LEPSM
MPFGSFFKKIFKRGATDIAKEVGGEDAGKFVEKGFDQLNLNPDVSGGGGFEDQAVDSIVQVFSGKQEGGMKSLFSNLGGSLGGFRDLAIQKGLDPSLVDAVLNMISGKKGGSAEGASGGGGGGGFDFGSLMSAAGALTTQSSGSMGGLDGFINLLGGGGGSGGSNDILNIILGLVKSFFNIKTKKDPALKDWGKANPDAGKSDDSIGAFGDHLIRDLIDPGKKEKDRLDDDNKGDKKTGKDDVKGWFGKHPEIGKIQKDVFDDIFDVKDEDTSDEDEAPLIPTPEGFEEDCSILNNASILFLNTNILLELRKKWRFLFSTKSHDPSEFAERLVYQGPTLLIIQSDDGAIFGAFASTSWGDTKGGWSGNGDSFIFAIKPKMACFYSTGKNERFLFGSDSKFGLGGRPDALGLGIASDLSEGEFNSNAETFDLPSGIIPSQFSISHVEAWALGSAVDPSSEKSGMDIRRPNTSVSGGHVDMGDLMGQIS